MPPKKRLGIWVNIFREGKPPCNVCFLCYVLATLCCLKKGKRDSRVFCKQRRTSFSRFTQSKGPSQVLSETGNSSIKS